MASLYQWVTGELVQATDLDEENAALRRLVAEFVPFISGQTSCLGTLNPLTVVPGGGLSIDVGGTNQNVVLAGTLCVDFTGTQNFTLAANTSGEDRIDLLVGQAAALQTAAFTRKVKDPTTGIITDETCYKQLESAMFEVVEGTPGAGRPATPSGYVAIAAINVSSGESTTVTGDITILLGTLLELLIAAIGNSLVTNINGNSGNVTLVSPNGTIAIANLGSGEISLETASGSSTPGVGGVILAQNSGTETLSLAIPAGTTTYTVSAEAFAGSGSSETGTVTCSGSSSDTSGEGFNGGHGSGSSGGEGGVFGCFNFGTCKGGDNLEVSYGGPGPVLAIRIIAVRTS